MADSLKVNSRITLDCRNQLAGTLALELGCTSKHLNSLTHHTLLNSRQFQEIGPHFVLIKTKPTELGV